jgi:hypothetical protein
LVWGAAQAPGLKQALARDGVRVNALEQALARIGVLGKRCGFHILTACLSASNLS